ncbi:GATA zinc finger domain-containing protein 14 [Drosophila serrata]|uniref:GATA zinc finger domain-containing protein 14 n=1 Tax=Drosophila serrata TaxID=7274 RepID=UPI000A1CF4F5|nr:GATA zinc finger domain-containing protein 14 [Drosophila serrata]XP_020818177.1 GATA zinc finger domain-containing protein 14 [Drosophila serrata]
MEMANMISNNHGGGSSSNNSSGNTYGSYNNSATASGHSSGEAARLRDVCNILNSGGAAGYQIPAGGCAYDHIIALMRGLDLQDDGIVLNSKIKTIETDFCNIVRDESMLCESMDYLNDKALGDGDTALKFALLFSSRNFDALAMKETKVRSAMLKILETNFLNADTYRMHDKNRLYNSITLLGEYYHRVRLADNAPITILGESLLDLLTRELNDTSVVLGTRIARLVLSQITLNGEIMRQRHKVEIDLLLFHVRRHLIMQPALTAKVKAMLLMVLDLFYSHFKHIGHDLEAMYTDYLVVEDGEEDGVNNNGSGPQHHSGDVNPQQHQQQQQLLPHQQSENGSSANTSVQDQDSFDPPSSTKKWSEQVCEDSFYDVGFVESEQGDERYTEGGAHPYPANNSIPLGRHGRRSFQPRQVSRPLKPQQATNHQQQQQPPSIDANSDQYPSMASNEDRDESKPLPSWRKTRFNRNNDGDHSNGRSRDQQRRYSVNCDDDQHSVRSEGAGNLRLYSIHDRRKHSQERHERNMTGGGGGGNYNSIVNSNWDQRDRDDRSERSYISNYERGSNYKRGGRFHNRNTYDKPPRFQKQQQQQMQQQHQGGGHQKIHSDTWRRSNTAINSGYQDENCAYNSNGPESNSRSSSRARTLPRPSKSHMDKSAGYRYNQSPTQGGGGGGGGPRFPRYSSQSSLASEASSTFDRRQQTSPQHQHQRHRHFTRRSQPDIHQPQSDSNWQGQGGQNGPGQEQPSSGKEESELVRNAQQTTKYMNYLSAQK